MSEVREYNGWSNKETWIVNLWLTNDKESYDTLKYIVKRSGSISEGADLLESFIMSIRDYSVGESSMWRDLLSAPLGCVNWYEIIECNW